MQEQSLGGVEALEDLFGCRCWRVREADRNVLTNDGLTFSQDIRAESWTANTSHLIVVSKPLFER
jgi:hypothetical protein